MNNQVLYDWIATVSGYSPSQIMRANTGAPRPTGDYITWQIISEIPQDAVSSGSYPDPSPGYDVTHTIRHRSNVTVSVDVYADSGRQILHNLYSSKSYQDTRKILADDGVALLHCTSIRDLSALDMTFIRPRFQADFEFTAYDEWTIVETDAVFDDYEAEGDIGDIHVVITPP